MYERHLKGTTAEAQAEKYLAQQGLKLLQRNFNCKAGEIDLIMTDDNSLVFVEVRYRSNTSFGSAVESVTPAKQQKIIRAAQVFLQLSSLDRPCRFDIVGIDGRDQISWLKNAFQT